MIVLMENPPLYDVLKRLLWSNRETQPQCRLLLLCSDLCSKYRFYFVSHEGVLVHYALQQSWGEVGEGSQECPASLCRDFESILFSVPCITPCFRRTWCLQVQNLFRAHQKKLTYFCKHLGFCCCFCSVEKVIIPVHFIFFFLTREFFKTFFLLVPLCILYVFFRFLSG